MKVGQFPLLTGETTRRLPGLSPNFARGEHPATRPGWGFQPCHGRKTARNGDASPPVMRSGSAINSYTPARDRRQVERFDDADVRRGQRVVDGQLLAVDGIHRGHVQAQQAHPRRAEKGGHVRREQRQARGEPRAVGPRARFEQQPGHAAVLKMVRGVRRGRRVRWTNPPLSHPPPPPGRGTARGRARRWPRRRAGSGRARRRGCRCACPWSTRRR